MKKQIYDNERGWFIPRKLMPQHPPTKNPPKSFKQFYEENFRTIKKTYV